MLIQDTEMSAIVPGQRQAVKFRARLFGPTAHAASGLVVVISPVPGDLSTSVTNSFEHLAKAFSIERWYGTGGAATTTTWIEHYPPDPNQFGGAGTFDQVNLRAVSGEGDGFLSLKPGDWKRISKDEAEALTGFRF